MVAHLVEKGSLIELEMKEHLIPFVKMTFRAMLIMLLHAILIQHQIIFEATKNVCMSYQGFFHLLNLEEAYQV